jgi:hypothetical protein
MHSRHLFDALYDIFATAASVGGPRYARRQEFPIAAGRDAAKKMIGTRVERLAK